MHWIHWDYYRQRFERNRGMRIDFVLGSPAFSDRVTGAFIDRDERDPAQGKANGLGSPSDHAPVIVDLTD
ncbi:MAG TPA: endonuclease/exonuclease/phosphatase family protein [Nocardioides sp.]